MMDKLNKQIDAIVDDFTPKLKIDATRLVAREIGTIKDLLSQYTLPNFWHVLWAFEYNNLPDVAREIFGGTLRNLMDTLFGDIEPALDMTEHYAKDRILNDYHRDYIGSMAERHADSSTGQIRQLLEKENPENEVLNRLDEWEVKRPGKILMRETIQYPMGFLSVCAFAMNYGLRWKTRSGKCPFCALLHNKLVRKWQTFAAGGDTLAPKGKAPMKIFSKTTHPPVHAGCRCFVIVDRG